MTALATAAMNKVFPHLKKKAQSTKELAELAGISTDQARKALLRMAKEGIARQVRGKIAIKTTWGNTIAKEVAKWKVVREDA